MNKNPMNIGIIGCGKISDAYFNGAKNAKNITVKACADLNLEVAKAKAEAHNCNALTVEQLLADPEIELVLNLTIPAAHATVGLQILEAGKHLYAEKPLAVTIDEADRLMAKAKEKNLRIGSATDTFLFEGAQTALKAINDGMIGTPTSGTAFMRSFGPENWHPNPFFYYALGGGPLLDMGPYYLAALISFIGPIKSVMARSSTALKERTAGAENVKGQKIKVTTETHFSGILEFESGAIITVIMSFDIQGSPKEHLTLNGPKGSLNLGDPNNFSANPTLYTQGNKEWVELPFTHAVNRRGIGVIDMADAIRNDRPHRANGELAYHVLETMLAFNQSSQSGKAIEIKSTVARPEALPLGLNSWEV